MKKRSCIYPEEVAQIIGKTDRTARRLLKKIRKHMGKARHQYVTISEFSSYTGIPEDEIRNRFSMTPK